MLTILNNGLRIDGSLRYAWFHLQDDCVPYYRCLALKELAVIPVLEREEYDLLGKMWGGMRGLHNAGINFAYAAMGIFDPDHIGIVQYYGAVAEGATEEKAAKKAQCDMMSVEAVLANFPQSKLASPTPDWFRWYLDFITRRGKFIAALLGHPDPRAGKHGSTIDGSVADDSKDDLAMEQNEILFRGLAKLRQNFVFQVLAENVARPRMTSALMRVAEAASTVASRRKGSTGIGFSLGIPLMAALSQSIGGQHSTGTSIGSGVSDGMAHNWGESQSTGQSHADSISNAHSEGRSWGHSVGTSQSTGISQSSGAMQSQSNMVANSSSVTDGTSQSSSTSIGFNQGLNFGGSTGANASVEPVGIGAGVSGGSNWGVSAGMSEGFSNTNGSMHSESNGVTNSSGISTGTSQSAGTSSMQGSSESWSEGGMSSDTTTIGSTDTVSSSQGKSDGWGLSHAESAMRSQSQGLGVSQGLSSGFSTGVVPGISLSHTWQTEDDVAERLTEILRKLESVANMASAEGGFMTNAFLFTDTPEGASAADALVPQAFHGPNVPTPMLTVHPASADEILLRTHAFAFCPWSVTDDGDPFGGELWTRYATLLTAGQLSALCAPGLFEEGAASTVMSPIPKGMGFYPNMPGDVVLGHQYSPETADLTPAQVRIAQSNLMHTMFAGDTGYGKSVAAIRMAYETTLKWHLRTVVLDFGAGWRSLLNAPGLEGHVEILQLWPDASRPMRWNPLQIGRNISPETQWRAFADVFGGIAQLGVKRQKQEMLEALRRVYLRAGVLVEDPEVRSHLKWGKVQPEEAASLGAAIAGLSLSSITSMQRQAIAVLRSSVIGLSDLYAEVDKKLASVPPRDTMLTGVLEGILFRLNPLVQGSAAVQFAPGKDTVPVEDFSKPWGVTIIEGGMFLDEFGKAFLLGWTGWHLYMDMVARRVHEVNTGEPLLQIFYEEANKIFVQSSSGEDEGGGISATQRFADMFRDARKYLARLHLVTQAPSLIAQDIVSSCNNLIVGFLKQPKDKDLVLSALARSEKGFRDEEWRRFVDDIPIGMTIGRFPYTTTREAQRPFLFRPLMLDVPEPKDSEIAERLGRISL
jgi:hypothetical protein